MTCIFLDQVFKSLFVNQYSSQAVPLIAILNLLVLL
jgi:hypothetical protein